MTLVVALVDGDDVWMAGDSCRTMGDSSRKIHFTRPKIFLKEGVAFGTCGWHGISVDIQHKFRIPSPSSEEQSGERTPAWTDEFQKALAIADGLRKFFSLEENKHHLDEDGDLGGSIMFGFGGGGGLYQFDSVFSMGQLATPFHAIGCAALLGIGSMATSERLDLSPQERLVMALEVGAKYDAAVGPPYTIITTKGQ